MDITCTFMPKIMRIALNLHRLVFYEIKLSSKNIGYLFLYQTNSNPLGPTHELLYSALKLSVGEILCQFSVTLKFFFFMFLTFTTNCVQNFLYQIDE